MIQKKNPLPKDDHQKQLIIIISQKPVKEWSVDLPDDGDYQNHSAEIKIPELNAGQYLILISSDKNFSYNKNAYYTWQNTGSLISVI